MKIKFHSTADHSNGNDKIEPIIIDFEIEATYELFQDDEGQIFDVYSFIDPGNNFKTRLEFGLTNMNIYTGEYTLNINTLKDEFCEIIDSKNNFKYQLITRGKYIAKKEKNKEVNYQLFDANEILLGTFNIVVSEI
ncbi:hypothetical protein [Mycoplasmopsis meleagridis]|uniref:hypothetical protein n=1 Tax=Mycoplasmopsis meleagridis TaxID=29561 RepID=UPI00073D6E38|nr:hypothetical protein [Mycoplasmopsis meleagridis]KUH47417.1 hypothetical protein ASB56_00920 [Mycoplasmopsis meleagridis]